MAPRRAAARQIEPKASPAWPADKVERRPVTELEPYARNARLHSEKQVGQIAASIEEFGWTVPVLVDETGGIIAGHGRVLAAKRLGLTDVPVMVARGWSEAQRRAYVLADNRLAENASWDEALLASELSDLTDLGFDVALIGFDEAPAAASKPGSATISDAPMQASFWLTVDGPLTCQAAAIQALKALAAMPGVNIHSNLREEI